MSKTITKLLLVFIAVAVILSMATPSYAQDATKKLGRGLVNVLTGWIELPKNIYETSVESNPLAGITIGLAKGLGMTVVRTGAGIYETVTFPFPLPQEYKPILEPGYVLEKSK